MKHKKILTKTGIKKEIGAGGREWQKRKCALTLVSWNTKGGSEAQRRKQQLLGRKNRKTSMGVPALSNPKYKPAGAGRDGLVELGDEPGERAGADCLEAAWRAGVWCGLCLGACAEENTLDLAPSSPKSNYWCMSGRGTTSQAIAAVFTSPEHNALQHCWKQHCRKAPPLEKRGGARS